MTFDELRQYFNGKSNRAIAKIIKVAPSQLTYYRKNGIPLGRQHLIEEQTEGKLKASSADKTKTRFLGNCHET